ncbi:TPA: EAL domain-containing protein [Clostridium perfringens]|nr:EAL domain-containing protein [Clostridium perfringens]
MRKSLNFDIYYQKKINIKNYTLDGIEVLARFKDKNGNFLNTENSINHLKQQICDKNFTYIVINKVFSYIDNIPNDKIPNISINITASEIEDSHFKLWINNLFVNRKWCFKKFEFEINEKCNVKNEKRFLEGLIFLKVSVLKFL